MFRYHVKLGVIVPSSVVVVEPEFNKMAPEGVTCHFHRFPFLGGRAKLSPGHPVDALQLIEELRGLGNLAVEAVKMLSHVNPKAVAMA